MNLSTRPFHSLLRLMAAAFMFLFLADVVLGQGVTTAAIYGTVTDSAGNPLPGGNIVAIHVPSGTTYGTTSRVNGDYTLPGLKVGGPYTVTASFVGYAKQEYTDLYLQLSQSLRQDFRLAEQAVQTEAVLVTGERSAILSAARTGAATNIGRDKIDRLPTLSRTFQDYYNLSPYFTGVGSSVAGRNSKYNNIQIDGANFNDLFGLGSSGTPGGQAGVAVAPISLEAIEEFQIAISPFDVRYAGFTGAGINAITRSGTNAFRGSAFYNLRNEDFAGKSPDALQAKFPSFKEKQSGFRLGGPIVQNKLFFFTSGEIARREGPFTRTFANDKVGTNASTASPDSLALLSNYLKSQYGYNTGSWSSIPQNDNSDKFFVRLDFNLSESHKLTARYNYLKADDDNSPSRFRATADVYSENARYLLQDKTHSFALQLTSLLSNRTSNEFILGYVNQLDRPVYYGTAFPTLEVRTVGVGTSDKTVIRLAAGSEEFRHQNELGQKYFEITDNFSLYLPNHNITIGAKVDLFKFRNLFIPDNFGFYQYNSIAAFFANKAPAAYTFRYSATSNPLQEANWGANQFGFYAQDEWTVNSRFKLVGGIRFDIPTYPDGQSYNKAFDSTFTANGYSLSTDRPPKSSVAISPRLGFNWAVDEQRNTQVRGGLGVFYGRFPFVWVSNQYSNNGVDFYTVTTAPSSFIADPNAQPKIATSLPTAEVDITDPDFKAPSIFRTYIAFDHRLPFDIVASVEGMFSWTQNDVYYQNINLAGLKSNGGFTPNGRLVGENREVWALLNTTTGAYLSSTNNANGRQLNSRFTAVYLIRNTNQGSNSNIVVQLQRENPADAIAAGVGYTWSLAKDVGGQNSTTASSGWRFNPSPGDPNNPPLAYADNDRRHRISANVQYRLDWGSSGLATTFGLFYSGLSGGNYSWVVNGDVNGDGFSDNDLIYIPKDANDVILMSAASGGTVLAKSDVAYTQLLALVDGDSYMKEHKGEMLQRNALHAPWAHQVNMRISQEIATFSGHNLLLSLDILNVFNLLNKDWGWVRVPSSNPFFMNFHSVSPAGTADAGKPRYFWTNPSDPSTPSNTLSRWTALFGMRYTF